jgi:hypothetical protein
LTGLGLIGDNYTLEFWFRHLRPDSSGPLLNYVAGRSGGATTSELVCVNSSYFGGHSNELCLVIGNTGYFTTNNFNPAEGLWYHAALTRTNSTVTLYVNGINLLSTNVANTGISPILDWARRGSDNVLFYQGDLDEIAVYPRALSQAEIQTHVAQATMQVPVAVAYYDTQIQADHPLVYYRCEESVGATIATNDATQDPFKFYSYPGTYYNGVTLQTTGPTILSRPTNNAAQFDGSNDYMKTPNLSGKLGDAYSVEFWLLNSRAENAVDITGYFFSRGAGATGDVIGINGKYDLLGHPNEVFLLLNNNKYFTNWNPPENQWMHLAFTRDGAGNVTLYKNGVSILTTNAPASGLPGTIDFGRRADNSWYLQGQMDEIAVYTNALTSAQVLAHYANWRDLGIRGTTFKFR